MKRLLLAISLIFVFALVCTAQTSTDNSPATREDVDRYLQAIHSREMQKKTLVAMAQGMNKMIHQLYVEHQSDLPPDYEGKMAKMMQDMFENMPLDDMMEAMIPVYQKHLTKGDLENLTAFYASPTGAKVLQEMPAIMQEAIERMTPSMMKYIETIQKKIREQTDVMVAQAKKTPGAQAQSPSN